MTQSMLKRIVRKSKNQCVMHFYFQPDEIDGIAGIAIVYENKTNDVMVHL